jgi:hypothetical protein
MQKTELQTQFINWVETKAKEKFYITNPFLLACLDEELELNLNSTIDGVPFHQHYSADELMEQVLNGWHSTAKSFLQLPKSNVNIIFKQIPVPNIEDRQKILSELSDLVSKCEA